ncbi:MAG: hypothetical protein KBS74_06810 [Clostridiales bacterium]|nr:hypothetical protein [Candidatus Cacconaster stercorequi]
MEKIQIIQKNKDKTFSYRRRKFCAGFLPGLRRFFIGKEILCKCRKRLRAAEITEGKIPRMVMHPDIFLHQLRLAAASYSGDQQRGRMSVLSGTDPTPIVIQFCHFMNTVKFHSHFSNHDLINPGNTLYFILSKKIFKLFYPEITGITRYHEKNFFEIGCFYNVRVTQIKGGNKPFIGQNSLITQSRAVEKMQQRGEMEPTKKSNSFNPSHHPSTSQKRQNDAQPFPDFREMFTGFGGLPQQEIRECIYTCPACRFSLPLQAACHRKENL